MGMLYRLCMGWGCPLVDMDQIHTLLPDMVEDNRILLFKVSVQVVWDSIAHSNDAPSIEVLQC